MVERKELNRYYAKIKRHLKCPHQYKEDCLEDFGSQLEEFLHDSPATSLQDVYSIFGAPDTVAQNYTEQMGTPELGDYLARKKRSSIIIKINIFVFLILFISFLAFLINETTKPVKFEDSNAIEVFHDLSSTDPSYEFISHAEQIQ